MTPKEKAKQLTEKMINGFQFNIDEYTAIQCALIAVDEILDVDCKSMNEEDFDEHIEYWEEVKQEILKL